MKQYLILLLIFILMISCLASCDWFVQDTKQNTNHEHTWEYIQYETGHFKQYTCGCPSPDIMVGHCDNDDNGTCDECEYGMCSTPERHKRVVNWNGEEHWWVYSCECTLPEEKEPHYDNDGNVRCDACNDYMPEPILLSTKEPWLNEISSENVTQIQTIHSGEDIPDMIEKISLVTDKETIAKIIQNYQELYITPLDPMVCYDIAPGCFQIKFTLSNGEVKQIIVNGGFMYGYYSMKAPRIDGYESAEINYKLEYIGDNWCAYFQDDTYIGFICDTRYWEFVEEEYTPENEPKYYLLLKLTYYTFKITVYDEYHFCFNDKYYKLTNRNFDDMLEDVMH